MFGPTLSSISEMSAWLSGQLKDDSQKFSDILEQVFQSLKT
jgi:hypothetical protein